ncbi:DUF853 domain-containing protein [Eubacteriales bacterium OttesenSCG-928-N13]|nr:DUF853 domain-containing protein [Eubacteriales bacterium OttesenSCG-928-N13]
MIQDNKILVGKGENPVFLLPQMANRHGLIAGATGTGKTTTLKVLAEGFSAMGVPVFLADIKGDLMSLCQSGAPSDRINERLAQMGITDFTYSTFPLMCWDVFGQGGHPVRATISEMGPLLLSRLLNLNDTQQSVLSMIFKIADEQNLLLLDMKDFKSILQYVADHAQDFATEYGFVTKQSIGAIQRNMTALEQQGADSFFGEPALDINDWLRLDSTAKGYVNVLDATKLYQSPGLYATMLLYLLSELFEKLPEVGDPEKPKMVFFFDEAHLLFDDAPKALTDKIVQVVRLVRSKGVGVYFITQSPMDVPGDVLAQLSNRIQHALRAYTPADQKVIKATSDTFRPNPAFKVQDVITQLATGEALISFLDEKGVPGITERALILPPQSFMGTVDAAAKQQCMAASPVSGKYDTAVDRESAYEMLVKKHADEEAAAVAAAAQAEAAKQAAIDAKAAEKQAAAEAKQAQKQQEQAEKAAQKDHERNVRMVENMAGSVLKGVGREVARNINNPMLRSILGSLVGGTRRY